MSPLIFTSCRDCLSYLASAETVRDLLLPAETTIHEKWLPAETVCVILFPAKTLSRKLNQKDSLCMKLFTKHKSLQEARDRGQSRQKPNMMDSLCRKGKLADMFIPCVKVPGQISLSQQNDGQFAILCPFQYTGFFSTMGKR